MVKDARASVAIFGGSFDPPHRGHQQIVALALEALAIEKLIVVPAYLNPFKQSSLASPSLRLEWCHTLFDPLERVMVSDYEISRGKSTYTSQTIRHFQRDYNVNYLIIGSDNLDTLTLWHEFEWLNAEVTWVIATRSGSEMNTDRLNQWIKLELDETVSSSRIRNTKQLDEVDSRIRDSVNSLLKEKK